MRWLDVITDSMDMILSKPREVVKDRKPGMLKSIGSHVLSPKPLTLRGALPHYLSLKKELAYSSS